VPWNLSLSRMLRTFLALGGLAASHPAVNAQTRPTRGVQHFILHSFGGPDGAGPLLGVIADAKGAFYGTTAFGGKAANGTIFKLTPSKSGYSEKVLHSFSGGSEGYAPDGLVGGNDGVLYGGTLAGGQNGCGVGCGTVFKLTPKKSGYAFSVVYRFRPGNDANQPVGTPVLDKDGAIYGVTQFGGSSNNGAVFKLTPGKSGYTERVLYSFPGGAGGTLPQAGLTIDTSGSLYGTTYYGGTGSCGGGCGTVFKLAPSKSGYTDKVLYSFRNDSDGVAPSAALTVDESTGAIFGTTEFGGADFYGTVFKLTPSGSDYIESIVYRFNGSADGGYPEGQLLLSANGVLFGTTARGPGSKYPKGLGTLFQLTPSGSSYAFKLIYGFLRPSGGSDPDWSTLISDAKGALYGTTRSGGSKLNCNDGGETNGCGTVFKLILK
jgi:uncharacterized repeat protein (TIGR03803 family)